MSLAERLKEARAALKLKQEEIAAISGIPLDTYRKYEGGKAKPGADALGALAKAGVDLNWLVTGVRYMTDASGKQFFEYPLSGSVDSSRPVATLPPAAPPIINVDALVQAFCVSLQTAPKGESPEKSARKAVEFYLYCVERGLITAEGQGEGNDAAAA